MVNTGLSDGEDGRAATADISEAMLWARHNRAAEAKQLDGVLAAPIRQKYVFLFSRLSQALTRQAGRPATFATALFLIIVWAVCGPFFGYSATWQLVINTISSIVTLLMVLLIQNTQNRDAQAIQMKLDELIHKNEHAQDELIEIENLTDLELAEIRITQREIHSTVAVHGLTPALPRSQRPSIG